MKIIMTIITTIVTIVAISIEGAIIMTPLKNSEITKILIIINKMLLKSKLSLLHNHNNNNNLEKNLDKNKQL